MYVLQRSHFFCPPLVSLNLHRETFDGNKVDVIEADGLIIWCDRCARVHFGFVCADAPRHYEISVPIEDDGKNLHELHATLALEVPSEVNVMDMIEVYLEGLSQDNPAITDEVRAHIHSLITDGNAEFLTILLEAIRDGLADSC